MLVLWFDSKRNGLQRGVKLINPDQSCSICLNASVDAKINILVSFGGSPVSCSIAGWTQSRNPGADPVPNPVSLPKAW